MGCGVSVNSRVLDYEEQDYDQNLNDFESGKITSDQLATLRANIGGIKMLAKCDDSRRAFLLYLKSAGDLDKLLSLYLALAEIKALDKDNLCSRTSGILWRCKSEYDEFKARFAEEELNNRKRHDKRCKRGKGAIQSVVWDCLGRLRSADIKNCPEKDLLNLIAVSQEKVLQKLIQPFEGYLKSEFYQQWQREKLDKAKQKPSSSKGLNGFLHQTPTCSDIYPQVLVVDDSPVCIKLVGRSLETDGHLVDRAINGEVALNLMKTQEYDVVLIDINMPILDGYETVRLFRQFEKLNRDISHLVSEVSSLSDDFYPPVNDDCYAPPNRFLNPNKVVPTQDDVLSLDDSFEQATPHMPSPCDGTATLTKESLLTNDQNHSFKIKVRAIPEYHNQFIIGMSSSVDDDTKMKAIACGMDYFLPKPFTIVKFMEAIREGNKSTVVNQLSEQ
jgi:CheY-like chemotaxis protein